MKITYIRHSAFLAELKSAYLLFDYTQGRIPQLKPEKPLMVFVSHRHGDHYSPVIFDLLKTHHSIRYVLSDDIWRKRLPEESLANADSLNPGMNVEYGLKNGVIERGCDNPYMKISTYKSTDEGVAFLIEAEGRTLYHAGDLNNWTWDGEPEDSNASMAKEYSAQIDQIAGMHIDVAFLPLDPRQETYFYLGMDEFLRKVDVRHVFPMHCWGDYSVTGKIKALSCSAGYRDRIEEITKEGECFVLSFRTDCRAPK